MRGIITKSSILYLFICYWWTVSMNVACVRVETCLCSLEAKWNGWRVMYVFNGKVYLSVSETHISWTVWVMWTGWMASIVAWYDSFWFRTVGCTKEFHFQSLANHSCWIEGVYYWKTGQQWKGRALVVGMCQSVQKRCLKVLFIIYLFLTE